MKKDLIKIYDIINVKETKNNQKKYLITMNFLIILNKTTFGFFQKHLLKNAETKSHLVIPVIR